MNEREATDRIRSAFEWRWDGEAASRFRESAGLSLAEVAVALGYSGSEAIRRHEVSIEKRDEGRTAQTPTLDALCGLARLYGRAPGDFFRRVPKR